MYMLSLVPLQLLNGGHEATTVPHVSDFLYRNGTPWGKFFLSFSWLAVVPNTALLDWSGVTYVCQLDAYHMWFLRRQENMHFYHKLVVVPN